MKNVDYQGIEITVLFDRLVSHQGACQYYGSCLHERLRSFGGGYREIIKTL